MISKKTMIIGAVVTVLAAGAASAPYAFRVGTLRWAKSSARRATAHLDNLDRQNLNSIPNNIALTPIEPEAQRVDALNLGGAIITVPKAQSRSDSPKHVRLDYRGYQVTVLRPTSTAAADAVARQLQYKGLFDELSASYHLRLDDLERQPDMASLRRFQLLISQKPVMSACREAFTCGSICGFIEQPDYDKRKSVIEVFVPEWQMGFGVRFEDSGGLTDDDVHQFLQTLRFRLNALPGAAPHAN